MALSPPPSLRCSPSTIGRTVGSNRTQTHVYRRRPAFCRHCFPNLLDARYPGSFRHPDHHRGRDEHHPWRNVWPARGLYAGTVWDSCTLQWGLTRLPDLGRTLRGIFSDYCRSALGLGRRGLASIALSRGAGIDYVDCSAFVTRNRQGRHFADLNAGACQEDSFLGRQRRVVDVLPEAASTTAVFSAARPPSSS